MRDEDGLTAEMLERLRQIADGEVVPTIIPRTFARAAYDNEMAWIRGDTPWQRLMRGERD